MAHGGDVITTLHSSATAFDVITLPIRKIGVLVHRVACTAHITKDERAKEYLITLADSPTSSSGPRPAALDHQKATGVDHHTWVYNKIYENINDWKEDFINPYRVGEPDYREELANFEPHKGTYKDGNDICSSIGSLVNPWNKLPLIILRVGNINLV
jgi:hypothetical protein